MLILKSFFSMASAIILLLIFATASAIATIIESVYNTQTAWNYIYGTSWFGIVQVLIALNLAYNIFAYKLHKKITVFLFHFSFIIILIGAGITRYFGFEGTIHIRENGQSNEIFTRYSFINFSSKIEDKIYETNIAKEPRVAGNPGFNMKLKLPNEDANLKFIKYIPNASYKYIEHSNGKPVIDLVVSNDTKKREISLLQGNEINIGNIVFLFNKDVKNANKFIKFELKNNNFTIESNLDINTLSMLDGSQNKIKANQKHNFIKQLYSVDGINFAPKLISTNAKQEIISLNEEKPDAIIAELSYGGEKKEVALFHNNNKPIYVNINGTIFNISWGYEVYRLPFKIHLDDFELKRYPGSKSPMSYSSEISIKNKEELKYKIYMNHVLDYDGYRFFQSSYDVDEKGTILSVNKDPGKIPTYIGYFLLGLGLILNLINPKSRFRKLGALVNKDAIKLTILCLSIFMFNQKVLAEDLSNHPLNINQNHAEKLSRLIVQSQDGRMQPFDTISKDVLDKFNRNNVIMGLNSNQAALSIMLNPDFWRKQKLISLNSNKELKKILGINEKIKFASFDDFFEFKNGTIKYKLTRIADKALRKHPGSRNSLDKDIIKIDERLNVFYLLFTGDIFKIFPKKNDPSNTWYSPTSALLLFDANDRKEVSKIMQNYFNSAAKAMDTGNWNDADKSLEEIFKYQKENGSSILPSKEKINIELLFNKLKIFDRLTMVYLIFGLSLLSLVLTKMLKPKINLKKPIKIIYYANILAFMAHSLGLMLRWYIAQHAPWSNAYESMVYIAWALSLSGIIFSKKSYIVMALTSILSSTTLFVAHLNWLDPKITTLVPVLDSYWLNIHVSVITASYGFLGLCSLLGFFTLIMISIQNTKNKNTEISKSITEASRINEMSMIFGLSLLTLGNFLGGVWANESWGRYWGWDSKETWALISILIYASVLHLRLIPKFNNQFIFALTSMFAYWSIIMTYFGVNFYLAGLHSYAKGDPIPIPNFIWIVLAIMFILSFFAYKKRKICGKL